MEEKNLKKRRGMVMFRREFLMDNPLEENLREIFSNFFPINSENVHSYYFYDHIKMTGLSKHFRELEEGEKIPQYDMIFITDRNKLSIEFSRMVEIIPE